MRLACSSALCPLPRNLSRFKDLPIQLELGEDVKPGTIKPGWEFLLELPDPHGPRGHTMTPGYIHSAQRLHRLHAQHSENTLVYEYITENEASGMLQHPRQMDG